MKDIRRYNLAKSRIIKITAATVFWFAVFFVINLAAKRYSANGMVVDAAENMIVLAVSAIISLLGFVASLYAIFYFERFSFKKKNRK